MDSFRNESSSTRKCFGMLTQSCIQMLWKILHFLNGLISYHSFFSSSYLVNIQIVRNEKCRLSEDVVYEKVFASLKIYWNYKQRILFGTLGIRGKPENLEKNPLCQVDIDQRHPTCKV